MVMILEVYLVHYKKCPDPIHLSLLSVNETLSLEHSLGYNEFWFKKRLEMKKITRMIYLIIVTTNGKIVWKHGLST